MAKKKQRSVFWVVSTHVVTTGFVMPVVADLIGNSLVKSVRPAPLVAILIVLALQMLGYIGGVYYSLSYLRRSASIENPKACIKPSIITFVVLAIVGLCANTAALLLRQHLNPVLGVALLLVFYAVISLQFAQATRRGFSEMKPSTAED
jgi:hypothetical protein